MGFGFCLCSCSTPDRAATSSTVARVSYYRSRVGGRSTYPAYARLGLALLQQYRETGDDRDYYDAITKLQQSLSYQRNFDALLGLGLAVSERHQFTNALPYIREALSAMPGHPEAEGALFDIHLALGDSASAGADVTRMLTQAPGFAAFSRAAALAEYNAQFAAAADYMKKARADADKLDLPPFTRAWCDVRIGSLYMAQCDATTAKQFYDRALALVPRHFFAREHLAEWHAAQGQWRAAETLYRDLLKQRPEAKYRYALAEALDQEGHSAEARREIETAIGELRKKVAAGAIDQYRELATILLCENRDAAEALDLARRDWAMRHDIFGTDTLALASSASGQYEEAVRMSAPLVAGTTNQASILLHGALIRYRAGRGDEAAPLLKRALACPLAFTTTERKALGQVKDR